MIENVENIEGANKDAVVKAAHKLERQRDAEKLNPGIQITLEGKLSFPPEANVDRNIKSSRYPTLPIYYRNFLIDLLEKDGEYYAILKPEASLAAYLKSVQRPTGETINFHVVQNGVSYKATVDARDRR